MKYVILSTLKLLLFIFSLQINNGECCSSLREWKSHMPSLHMNIAYWYGLLAMELNVTTI
jgi:hypothetical protein